ncbi:MAG: FecR domain-containing protein [Saprospiraceae bacterium]|nr:FecR domain-containing protein [Saprospiraceae bacterium]
MSIKEELLHKLFYGECSESELIQLCNILKDSKSEEDLEVMQVLWDQMDAIPTIEPSVSTRIRSQIEIMRDPVLQDRGGKAKTISRRALIWKCGVAASILLLIASLASSIWMKDANKLLTVSTAAERHEIVLPDGSKVNLNLNSTLSYLSDWTDTDDRVVWLEGEAFLNVKKQNGKKFHVKTKDLTVEVVGTSFNVNCHREETEIYLEEGKIKLHMAEAGIQEMAPGDLFIYSSDKAQIIEQRSDSAKELYTGWKDGHLFFRDMPIGDVLNRIEENYAVKIKVLNQNLLKRPISTGVPTANLETAVAILEKTMGVDIALSDGVLVIN